MELAPRVDLLANSCLLRCSLLHSSSSYLLSRPNRELQRQIDRKDAAGTSLESRRKQLAEKVVKQTKLIEEATQ
eukprot:3129695-Amphidinium_carterae.1